MLYDTGPELVGRALESEGDVWPLYPRDELRLDGRKRLAWNLQW